MSAPRRIVVLGGYGQFGTRICRALLRHAPVELWIAGRRIERARALAAELETECGGQSTIGAVEIDIHDPKLARRLGGVAPIVVVHAAGPFQAQDYSVAEACLACRSHYVDLADARRFVADFSELDRDANRRRLVLVSGASTLPGVSSAVVDRLGADLHSISAIETSIAPAGRSPRGPATVAAVLSYCGKPIETLENGAWTRRFGWQRGRSIAYPVFERRVAACDVPDLELFPTRYAGVETVTFHAGPEFASQHAGLRVMAAAARAGLVRDWSRYANAFARTGRWFESRGSDVGAMQVVVTGRNEAGTTIRRTWDLVAGSNHGPQIPCAPAIVLARKLLNGELGGCGARACLGLVDLDDVAGELARFDIAWQVKEEAMP